jgi:hypothetical protein
MSRKAMRYPPTVEHIDVACILLLKALLNYYAYIYVYYHVKNVVK